MPAIRSPRKETVVAACGVAGMRLAVAGCRVIVGALFRSRLGTSMIGRVIIIARMLIGLRMLIRPGMIIRGSLLVLPVRGRILGTLVIRPILSAHIRRPDGAQRKCYPQSECLPVELMHMRNPREECESAS